jgi:hypothetical protein
MTAVGAAAETEANVENAAVAVVVAAAPEEGSTGEALLHKMTATARLALCMSPPATEMTR